MPPAASITYIFAYMLKPYNTMNIGFKFKFIPNFSNP